jgi:hypothetical protein
MLDDINGDTMVPFPRDGFYHFLVGQSPLLQQVKERRGIGPFGIGKKGAAAAS